MTDQEAMKLHELIDELRAKLQKSLKEIQRVCNPEVMQSSTIKEM